MVEMTGKQRERRIQEMMEMHGTTREEAEMAVAIEIGESSAELVQVDAEGETGTKV